jgi:hypothetical protein
MWFEAAVAMAIQTYQGSTLAVLLVSGTNSWHDFVELTYINILDVRDYKLKEPFHIFTVQITFRYINYIPYIHSENCKYSQRYKTQLARLWPTM